MPLSQPNHTATRQLPSSTALVLAMLVLICVNLTDRTIAVELQLAHAALSNAHLAALMQSGPQSELLIVTPACLTD